MTYLGPSLRRTRRPSRPWVRALVAIAVSLAVNALAVREVLTGHLFPRPSHPVAPQSVALAPLSPSQWEANRRATSGAVPPRTSSRPAQPVAATPPPPPPTPPGQVVDVAPSKDSTPPKDSRFVSERDNTVEKETRSRFARPGYANTLPKPTDPHPAHAAPPQEREVAAGEGGRQGAKRPAAPRAGEARASGGNRLPDQPARDRLALNLDRNGQVPLDQPRQEIRGQGGAPSLGPGASDDGAAGGGDGARAGKTGPLARLQLHPSAETYDRLAGGPAPDHLEGVEEGDGTYLNTREWKYAGYFNRIKEAVSTHWDPSTPLLTRDPTGQRLAYKDWLTIVTVTLDDAGGLKKVTIQKSSGLDFLDRSAEEAFRKAQPFVNPPRGLVNDHGEIAFNFGFIVTGSSGSQIFRLPTPPH